MCVCIYTHMRIPPHMQICTHTYIIGSTRHISISALKVPSVAFGEFTCRHDCTKISPLHTELWGTTEAEETNLTVGNSSRSIPHRVLRIKRSVGSQGAGRPPTQMQPRAWVQRVGKGRCTCRELCVGENEEECEAALSLGELSESHGVNNHPCASDSPCVPAWPLPEFQSHIFSYLPNISTWVANRYFKCYIFKTELLISLSDVFLSGLSYLKRLHHSPGSQRSRGQSSCFSLLSL